MNRIVVLDTNCLIQALPSGSKYHIIWTEFLFGSYNLCVSNEILSEYEEIISRLSSATIAHSIVEAIVRNPNTIFKNPFFRFQLIEQDPDDNKFVDCAIIGQADYVVSEDNHFNVLKDIPFPSVRVISLDDFLNSLKK